MSDIAVCKADTDHAADACCVLRRSISEVCSPDYGNDPKILGEWLSNKNPQNVAAWMEDAANYSVVAKQQNLVVGFALLRGDEILLNYVIPECLGQGAGHMMLLALERQAAAQGMSELRCMSTTTACGFYRRHGFEKAGAPVQVGEIVIEFPLRMRIDT